MGYSSIGRAAVKIIQTAFYLSDWIVGMDYQRERRVVGSSPTTPT